jgi:hypothetical protein
MATPTPVLLPAAAQVSSLAGVKSGAFSAGEFLSSLQNSFQQDYRTDLVLTSAQILALQTTSVTLIPAPGLGLFICPETIIMRMSGGTQYTDAGGAVSFTIGSMSVALAANTIFTGPTAGQRSQQIVAFTATSTAANPPTNENAAMTIGKITNNFAAGTGTMRITVFYTVEANI